VFGISRQTGCEARGIVGSNVPSSVELVETRRHELSRVAENSDPNMVGLVGKQGCKVPGPRGKKQRPRLRVAGNVK